jgi:hypothetical protein
MLHKIKDALKIRARAMSRKLKLIHSGYAKDVASGIRARQHAKDYKTDMEAVE